MANWSVTFPFEKSIAIHIPEKSGVYQFMKDGIVVYVGETGNLHRRFTEYIHGDNPCVTKHATHFKFKLVPHPEQRKNEEAFTIGLLKPLCNIQHR